ncbi:uncharacterized protein PAE49_013626 [Odontesthes bonariensis]|uniref:uncharacterized protein LOC142396146 n=1 Tax=Odontesthes bonariensis TaxID=219752 RepID=UPI003F587D71
MVTMFSLSRAAVLVIQLSEMWLVFAGTEVTDHENLTVSRGDSVMLTCNISQNNATQITWSSGRFKFVYHNQINQTVSNFSSERVRIDANMPTTLNIFSAQQDNTGLYKCEITDRKGVRHITWNLTVSENHKDIVLSKYAVILPSSAAGLLLCCITLAVCLCRKCWTRTQIQDPVQSQAEGEVTTTQLQDGTDRWRNCKQRREYMERMNSIYGQMN